MDRCACCREPLGRCTGVSSIFGSRDTILCEECWLEEDEMIDAEGTNAPEYSEAIKARLASYRG